MVPPGRFVKSPVLQQVKPFGRGFSENPCTCLLRWYKASFWGFHPYSVPGYAMLREMYPGRDPQHHMDYGQRSGKPSRPAPASFPAILQIHTDRSLITLPAAYLYNDSRPVFSSVLANLSRSQYWSYAPGYCYVLYTTVIF